MIAAFIELLFNTFPITTFASQLTIFYYKKKKESFNLGYQFLKYFILKRILIIVLLFTFSIGFSQTEKLLHGKILSGKTSLSGIDIVNASSKKSTSTNSKGAFSILAKADDELLIISKDYIDKTIVVMQQDLDADNLVITLEKKPIELKEVSVTKAPSVKVKSTQTELAQAKLAKQANTPKVVGVYDGSIENGLDFVQIGKGIVNLFKGKDGAAETPPSIGFKEYMTANFTKDFYTQKLKLKPEEIELFLSYCEADSKAKEIAAQQDPLKTTEFLISKNEEFKKLQR